MSVSIHPYFQAHAGMRESCLALLPTFVAATQPDADCLYYEFTSHDDVIFCREAYVSGAAALAHITSVGPLLEQMLSMADLTRLEIHGPAVELEIMKPALAALNPAWFETAIGITR